MNKISVEDRLPKDNQYVLIHLTNDNLIDIDDPKGGRYWVVAKFVKGLSKADRAKLDDDNQRKRTYCFADEHGNNQKPYRWDTFGSGAHFGQDADFWCELPQ